jgi:hypothetical protein
LILLLNRVQTESWLKEAISNTLLDSTVPFSASDKPDPIVLEIYNISHPDTKCTVNNIPFIVGAKDIVKHDITVKTTENPDGSYTAKCTEAC